MTSFYVSSKGFVAECNLTSDRKVTVQKYRFDFERELFIKVSDFCWNAKVKVEIDVASTVVESVTGQHIPTLLVSHHLKDNRRPSLTCFLIFVDLVNDEFVPLRKFDVNFSSFCQSEGDGDTLNTCSTYITDGPCVAVFSKSYVVIFYSEQRTVLDQFVFNYKDLKFDFQECCKYIKSTVIFKASLGTQKIEDFYLLFILVHYNGKCSIHGSDIKCMLAVIQFYEKKFVVLKADQFIPYEYYESLTCMQIRYVKKIGPEMFNSELYIGTKEGYLVHVKNGNLIQCCNISEIGSVVSLKVLSNFTGANILADTKEVMYELTSDLQVEKQYRGIISVLKGDFFIDGSFQYLLLKQKLSEGKTWILTNLKSAVLSSDDGKVGEQKQLSLCSSTAVKALKAKLQKEQILLHEEELQMQRRAQFLSDIFSKQVSIAAGVTCKSDLHQPSMISLIAGKENVQRLQCVTDIRVIGVKGYWQRTYEGIWCVGVDIECFSKRSTKIWLDVVLKGSHTKTMITKSSCLTLPSKQTCSEGSKSQLMSNLRSCKGNKGSDKVPLKRQKIFNDEGLKLGSEILRNHKDLQEKETGTVVCVLPVPVLACSNSVTANLILNWTHQDNNVVQVASQSIVAEQGGGEGAEQVRECHDGRVCTLCCGNLTLTSKDITSARYELDFNAAVNKMEQEVEDFQEMRNNQLAWQHLQTISGLVIKGNPGTLARFESLLTHTCGFLYNQHYDCYVSSRKALASVQVQLEPKTNDDRRELKVYTRNKKDLFLTIHYLYANLPDNIVILPKENTSADFLRKCVPALQREADFLSHGLRKLLDDHDADNASSDTDDEKSEDDLRKVGEKFKRKREKILRKQNDVMEDDRLAQFIEQYKKVQDLTDLVIATKGDFLVQ